MIPLLAAAAVLSSLGTMPKAPAVNDRLTPAGIAIKENGSGTTRWHEITSQQQKGYCIAPSWGGRLTNEYSGELGGSTDERPAYLERLVQKEGNATLERQRVTFEPREGLLRVSPVVSVVLKEVAREGDVIVWAYREEKNVVLVARAFDGGYDSGHRSPDEAGTLMLVGADGCSFAEARLDTSSMTAGASAELHGQLPKKGKGKAAVTPSFTVYASLSRLSRDPEPMLTVRVRVRDTT